MTDMKNGDLSLTTRFWYFYRCNCYSHWSEANAKAVKWKCRGCGSKIRKIEHEEVHEERLA
jgi:PHP family Zn ribbon phosphoesterase